jgi:hypothetical protein
MGIVIVGAMELCKNFFVPIVPKSHDIIEPGLLALVNHGVEHGVVEFFIVFPINVPHLYNWSHVLCS